MTNSYIAREILEDVAGHLYSQVVFMQIFALIAFFTQGFQPMLTHQTARTMMFIGAPISERTMPFFKCFAYRTVGISAKSVLLFKKVCKSKIIAWNWHIRTPDISKGFSYSAVSQSSHDMFEVDNAHNEYSSRVQKGACSTRSHQPSLWRCGVVYLGSLGKAISKQFLTNSREMAD